MSAIDSFDALAGLERDAPNLLHRFVRSHHGAVSAEFRCEAVTHRSTRAVNGEPRESRESAVASFSVSVRVRDRSGAVGDGQTGIDAGSTMAHRDRSRQALATALEEAYLRARTSAREMRAVLSTMGAAARSLTVYPEEHLGSTCAEVAAVYRRDPREVPISELNRLALDASLAVRGVGHEIAFNVVSAMTELRRELYANSLGSGIAQDFAFSQGDCYVVAQGARGGHQESQDTVGQQRGIECLEDGWCGGLMPNPALITFAVDLAKEAREVSAAPILTPPDGEVVIVTDPHFNALIAHEIVGHPCEADRALKTEAAYAGRSWLLRSLDDNELGKMVASSLLSACSDPTIDGYGHYLYDHEGIAGCRVMHFDRGRFVGFLNSRATAAILGAEPNGSARASEGWHVPLIRMSNTFFLPGATPPSKMIAEVEHGYYVSGHQIPSIAESRENFRISARRVHEIDHGRIGRLFRSGSVVADSKRFFQNVDAVGDDLRLIAIPNCGKGQPMQVKRMSNGGPSLRSRARLAGGD